MRKKYMTDKEIKKFENKLKNLIRDVQDGKDISPFEMMGAFILFTGGTIDRLELKIESLEKKVSKLSKK